MDNIEKKIFDKIDEMKDEIVKFHQDFVRIPSINPPGDYKEVSEFVEKKMNEIGLETIVKKKNVIGSYQKSDGPSLIIYGHMDTVPVFEGWTVDPHGGNLIDGKIYGRGACDDKACVTAEIFATKALFELGIDLKGKLTLISVTDEETLGVKGAGYLVKKGIVEGDACLIGDGRGGYAAAYMSGIIIGSVVIKGKKTHSLSFPDLPVYRNEYSGINAIQKMVPFLNFFTDLQKEFLKKESKYKNLPDLPSKVGIVCLSKIQGGEKMSGIPDHCLLYFTIGTIPEQDVESIKNKIMDFTEEYRKKDPDLNVKVNFTFSYEPVIADKSTKFACSLKESIKTLYNEEREFRMIQGANDGHYFHEKGMEVICFGSGSHENNIHAPDEFIRVEDLLETAKIFALTALNYLK